jgi:hypothetical protein
MIGLDSHIDIIEGDEELEVTRDGVVAFIDGKPIKADTVKFKITCNVQPLNDRELLMVPENDRYKEQYTLHVLGMPLHGNDMVIRYGKYFQVQGLMNWGNYQKCRIMLNDVGDKSND